MAENIGRIIEQITQARTGYDIFQVLRALLEQYGLSDFAIFRLPLPRRGGVGEMALLTSWNTEYLFRLIEGELLQSATLFHFLVDLEMPHVFDTREHLPASRSPSDRLMLDLMLAQGHSFHVLLPARLRTGQKLLLTLQGEGAAPDDQVIMELSFFGQHIFNRLPHALHALRYLDSPLNDREAIVLRRFANGAAVPDIAAELSSSETTIRSDLASAVKKVGARNQVHLVAEAIRKGWIL